MNEARGDARVGTDRRESACKRSEDRPKPPPCAMQGGIDRSHRMGDGKRQDPDERHCLRELAKARA